MCIYLYVKGWELLITQTWINNRTNKSHEPQNNNYVTKINNAQQNREFAKCNILQHLIN